MANDRTMEGGEGLSRTGGGGGAQSAVMYGSVNDVGQATAQPLARRTPR